MLAGMPSSYVSERWPASSAGQPRSEERGLVIFSGVLLVTLGVMQLFEGATSLASGQAFVTNPTGELIAVDAVSWGWLHLALGAITTPAGVGVLFGQTWARVVGIVVAALGAILHMLIMITSPVFCLIMVSIDMLVICALAVHGRELRRD
jgi:hypothetical protein